jgi:hypothetical protein
MRFTLVMIAPLLGFNTQAAAASQQSATDDSITSDDATPLFLELKNI